MEKEKTVKVDEKTWKTLFDMRISKGMASINEVIKLLLKNFNKSI